MLAIAKRCQPTSSAILRDLEALPFETLNHLMPQIEALRLRKHPLVLSARETWLMKRVQSGLPAALRQEHELLLNRRDAGALTASDRKRLNALVAEMDVHQARHLEWLIELAALRKTSVATLVKRLGLPGR
ncbi:MAG: hypothetical protein ACKVY0_27075 [Prosthecobacter sp.]|uniref:hypothetical protein n=1 Tax=Prosthecobacter sp. TaxID=1965333 RepID=UPI0039015DB0